MSNIHIAPVLLREEFLEASADELRVLVAIRESGTCDPLRLSELCKISRARAASAVSYWKSAGIVTDDGTPTITEVFESKIHSGELQEASAKQTANDIRDHKLSDMINECEKIMKRTNPFNSKEIGNLTALYTQYSVSDEYIVTLAAYEADRLAKTDKKLTVSKLTDKALRLIGKDIDTTEALEEYIKAVESETAIERELRHLLGIHGRTIAPTEKKYFKRWSREFGYFTEIIGEAYDITVANTGERSLEYMDTILTRWHKANCRTLAECREENEKFRSENAKKRNPKKNNEKAKPKYGNFDIDEAFKKALERSFGETK